MSTSKRTRFRVATDNMTTVERLASQPRHGVIVYDTDLELLYKYNGSAWGAINDAEEIGTGWAAYNDGVYTSSNKLVISSGSTTALNNNAATVINNHLPTGVSAFYNGTTKKITPENNGDSYIIRVSFKTSNSSKSGIGELILDIGATDPVLNRTLVFPKDANTESRVSSTNLIFSLATFLTNGGDLKVEAITGNISIWDIEYLITRVHKASAT